MVLVFNLLVALWLLVTFRAALFWLYLWQLKEYHIGRFLDHFRTYKGKTLLFNLSSFLKIILLFLVIYSFTLPPEDPTDPWLLPLLLGSFGLFFVYFTEALKSVLDFFQWKIKYPVFTNKVIFLFSLTSLIIFFFVFLATQNKIGIASLVVFDLLVPVIVSGIVLTFQPLFVMGRNYVLEAARRKMAAHKKVLVVAITGSYGKTSTKEFLATILSKRFNVLATKEHHNSEMGIAKCILSDLNESHEVFVVEMGAYKKGGIDLLCRIVQPNMGVVTGVNEQHMALFGSFDNLMSAEGGIELVKNLPNDGVIVLNGDNVHCLKLYKDINKKPEHFKMSGKRNQEKSNLKSLIYTTNGDVVHSDIWTESVIADKSSLSFIAMLKDKHMAGFQVNVLGRQNVQNMLAAILVAKELGMTLEEISMASGNIKQSQGGAVLNDGICGIHVVDSSYSSNSDGVIANLDYLSVFSQKKIIVMPCLIELGKKSAEIHQQIGKKIAQVCDMAIITTKDKFEEIKQGAVKNGMPGSKIIFNEKPKEIFNLITTFCTKGDAVLLEGRVPGKLLKLLTSMINKKP